MSYSLDQRLDIGYVATDSTITDWSNYLFRPGSDTRSITFLASNSLLIGYQKPLPGALFCDVVTNSQVPTMGQLEYYNGVGDSGFNKIQGQDDETNSLTKSGFIKWDLEDTKDIQPQIIANIADGESRYWYRIVITDNVAGPRVLNFINLMFSFDPDLDGFYPNAENLLISGGDENFLNLHIKARDVILKRLQKQGITVLSGNNNPDADGRTRRQRRPLIWDFFDIDELKDAAACWVLSHIMRGASNDNDDNFDELAVVFYNQFQDYMDGGLAKLSIDLDGDGKTESEAELEIKYFSGAIRFED